MHSKALVAYITATATEKVRASQRFSAIEIGDERRFSRALVRGDQSVSQSVSQFAEIVLYNLEYLDKRKSSTEGYCSEITRKSVIN